jgi:hypothetical protein
VELRTAIDAKLSQSSGWQYYLDETAELKTMLQVTTKAEHVLKQKVEVAQKQKAEVEKVAKAEIDKVAEVQKEVVESAIHYFITSGGIPFVLLSTQGSLRR